MEEEPRYIGIDVSKARVDVAVRPTGQRWAASYNETGVGELVSQIVGIGPRHGVAVGNGWRRSRGRPAASGND